MDDTRSASDKLNDIVKRLGMYVDPIDSHAGAGTFGHRVADILDAIIDRLDEIERRAG